MGFDRRPSSAPGRARRPPCLRREAGAGVGHVTAVNEKASLDESTIAALRQRIGIARPSRGTSRGHIEIVNADAIRHFALAYGDDNPLYCDPDYAASSVWGGPIAPSPLRCDRRE